MVLDDIELSDNTPRSQAGFCEETAPRRELAMRWRRCHTQAGRKRCIAPFHCHSPRVRPPVSFGSRGGEDPYALFNVRFAAFRCGISSILPSRDTAPTPDANAATTRLAYAISAALGVKAALITAT